MILKPINPVKKNDGMKNRYSKDQKICGFQIW